MSELKPCPFCGGEATIVKNEYPRLRRPSKNGLCHIVCWGCGTEMGYDSDYGGQYDSVDEATEAWNRRTGDEE